jgi:hypothetical protein
MPEPQDDKTKQQAGDKESESEYSEEELEGQIPVSPDSSYYEKAQDFNQLIKTLRIKYLGLKPKKVENPDGSIRTVYVKNRSQVTGINQEGVEANIRFLEPRLGKHVVLSNWDEERMYKIMMDDMITWRDIMNQNFEKYQLSESTLFEMRILVNDLLEYAYRRPVDDLERKNMRPMAKEITRLLGLDRKEEDNMQQNYPTGLIDKMKKEMNY